MRINGEVINSDCEGSCADYLDVIAATFTARDVAAELVSELQDEADHLARVAVKAAAFNATTRAAAVSRAYWAAESIGRVSVLVEWMDSLLDECVFSPLDDVVNQIGVQVAAIREGRG